LGAITMIMRRPYMFGVASTLSDVAARISRPRWPPRRRSTRPAPIRIRKNAPPPVEPPEDEDDLDEDEINADVQDDEEDIIHGCRPPREEWPLRGYAVNPYRTKL